MDSWKDLEAARRAWAGREQARRGYRDAGASNPRNPRTDLPGRKNRARYEGPQGRSGPGSRKRRYRD